MDARLVVAKGKTSVREIPLGTENTIIGRRTDCGLRIPSPLVSRQHCELKCAGDRLVVRDLGSSNGTFVNGTKVKQKQLKSGDTLGVGPITFIVQLGDSPVSPSDTARPERAAAIAGEDGADFVVAEEVESEDASDFVVGEEAAVGAGDSDFVVADEAAGDDASDFVVAEETDETAVGEISDFVVADEPATQADADFVVAEEAAADSDTVHMNAADLKAKKRAKGKPAAEQEAEPESAEPEQPKAKGGFFGRLFKKKEKKGSKSEPPPAVKPADKPSKKSKVSPETVAASKVAEETAEAVEPAVFVTEDEGGAGPSKPVGEDELADFLMGLNEKDQ